MSSRRFEFEMPADAEVVFDAFHYHHWRQRWDSLVSATHVLDGAPCPYVGAETQNRGAGWMHGLAMRTRFVSFDRPRVAAAVMVGTSFPFTHWAASMRHRPLRAGQSLLIYTYNFQTHVALRWTTQPLVGWVFDVQTRKRFERLRAFLQAHADEVVQWQAAQRPTP
jgi:hypothetical protein